MFSGTDSKNTFIFKNKIKKLQKNLKLYYAFIAQLVECSLGKAEVTGSIPVKGPKTNFKNGLYNSTYLVLYIVLIFHKIHKINL